MVERLSDAELWRSVERTLGDVLLPALGDDQEWARTAAVQLAGLARYAATRPPDENARRRAELRSVLTELAGNPLVDPGVDDADDRELQAIAGRALVAAVGRDDQHAHEVRDRLRSVLVRQLDDELAVTNPLVAAFRGRLEDRR